MRSGRSPEEIAVSDRPKQLFYGRRKARPLRAARADAMDSVFPRVKIEKPEDAGNFSFTPRETWFEIGFGNGDSLAAWHRAHPDIGFIACEPFLNGISNLCKLVAEDDLSNLRVWPDVAEPLLNTLPANSLDRVYLLNSDPWPKKRHIKRRFIQQESLTKLARLMKPGALLVMTTDHQPLAEWMFDEAKRHPGFTSPAQTLDDCVQPPEGWLTTRYEGKGRDAGRVQRYLVFIKVA